MAATFTMVCGIPGSGKTYIARHSNIGYIIDSDAVRKDILGNENDQNNNAKVFQYMFHLACESLKKDESCAYVATNLNSKRRAQLVRELRKRFPEIRYECIIVFAPIEVCIERNRARARHVPEHVIHRMVRSFETPQQWENWDSVRVVQNHTNDNFRYEMAERMQKFGSQENHHHSHTLFNHCHLTLNYAHERQFSPLTISAAIVHDIGKMYTKTFWSKDNEAHYPCHANVGAYLALGMGFNLKVANVINYHMVPFMDDKAKKVYRERLGEEIWTAIEQLHEADIASC